MSGSPPHRAWNWEEARLGVTQVSILNPSVLLMLRAPDIYNPPCLGLGMKVTKKNKVFLNFFGRASRTRIDSTLLFSTFYLTACFNISLNSMAAPVK